MLGMTESKVEDLKIIGTREMNMNANMKSIFYNKDINHGYIGTKYTNFVKPYFNDAQFNWETFNTRIIKTVFFEPGRWTTTSGYNDFGTIIRIKCYEKISRMEQTSDGEKCANWEIIDSFGVLLDKRRDFEPGGDRRVEIMTILESQSWMELNQIFNGVRNIENSDRNIEVFSDYKSFYDPVSFYDSVYSSFYQATLTLLKPQFNRTHGWENHVTKTDRTLTGEKGFLLTNGTFSRYEPVGVTWNDSYCRRITNGGRSGCFVERDINMFPIADLDDPRNNCSGSGFNPFWKIIETKSKNSKKSKIRWSRKRFISMLWIRMERVRRESTRCY